MRRLSRFAVLLVCLFAVPAFAVDTYVGTIASSGSSTTNLSTATPFRLGGRWKVSVQCDADTYLAEGPASSPPTVTSSNGLKVTAGALFDIDLTDQANSGAQFFAIGILPVSGSSNCKVFVSSYN